MADTDPDLIYFSAFLCDRVLQENDGVLSAIRVAADLVLIPPMPGVEPEDRPLHPVAVMAMARYKPGHRKSHQLRLILIKTTGEETDLVQEEMVPPEKYNFPEAPVGFDGKFEFGLVPVNMGTCRIVVILDDSDRVEIPITFVPKPAES